jgi:hypothetical protein
MIVLYTVLFKKISNEPFSSVSPVGSFLNQNVSHHIQTMHGRRYTRTQRTRVCKVACTVQYLQNIN